MKQMLMPLLVLSVLVFACQKEQADVTPATEEIPSLVTKEAAEVAYFEAKLQGEITSIGTENIYEYGFVWAATPGPTTQTASKKYFGPAASACVLTEKITGLAAGTTYYYRTFAITQAGIRYGNEVRFTTAAMPWVQTAEFAGAGRQLAVSFSIGGKGYCGIGSGEGITALKDFWEFDPAAKTWTRKADFAGAPRSAAIAFSIGNKGYIGTGADNNGGSALTYQDFWEYDPATDKWTKKADFPGGEVYYAACFTIGNKGYVGTGIKNGTLLYDFYEYDPAADRWTRKADFAGTPVDAAVGFSIGNKGYIGLGNRPLGSSKEFWEYNPATDQWSRKKDFPGAAMYFATGFALNGRGYVGLGSQGGTEFWEYNPGSDAWSRAVDFLGGSRENATGFVIGNKAYVGTGYRGGYLKDVWAFMPAAH
ncbi:MAG: galactose oxidase [Cytophagales bacterium]|nr:galactose oxidase [Cytophagales bacterium]